MAKDYGLQPEHPDFDRKPGDTQEFDGRTYTFGQNQYSAFWLAGPKDGRISCSRDYDGQDWQNPYRVGNISCKDFGSAATLAKKGAKKEYERALEIVARYEKED